MVEMKNVFKHFDTPKGKLEVLKDINLFIPEGDIFGVVGFSGAGKSTLIRCINGLERIDQGTILVNGKDISKLNRKELRDERKKIGMIFQQFNLLEAKTVAENIRFPLEISNYPKADIPARVNELLELVELSDKANAYPLQLSGGQKQRVGIARALANHTQILLCDEATSALDPQTTFSILELLKSINEKFNITIVVISHELDVLRYVTNHMAVLQDGEIVEQGLTKELFLYPKSETLKKFIEITDGYERDKVFHGGEGI